MKVKSIPEDFIVEELTDVVPVGVGDFTLYKLEKTGWTTPDAIAAIRRRWDIDLQRLSYGGLKDRHAVTTQFFTLFRGPERNLAHERVTVSYLGRVSKPFSSQDIRGNRFTIVLRDVKDTRSLETAAREIGSAGVPNYFDDQRFGSVPVSGEFIALEMIRGDYEKALKLALSAPYEHDRSAAKKEKAILRQHWGNWVECKAKLPRGHARSLVDYLVHHPQNFKGACARLRSDLSGLYLSAYQSHIWNKMLAQFLRDVTAKMPRESTPSRPHLVSLDLKLGTFPAPTALMGDWENEMIPMPSARWKPAADNPWQSIAERVLREDGLTLAAMRIPGLQKPYFSRGEREAGLKPENLEFESRLDDLNAGKRKAVLKFTLNRGSYATMVLKRLQAATS